MHVQLFSILKTEMPFSTERKSDCIYKQCSCLRTCNVAYVQIGVPPQMTCHVSTLPCQSLTLIKDLAAAAAAAVVAQFSSPSVCLSLFFKWVERNNPWKSSKSTPLSVCFVCKVLSGAVGKEWKIWDQRGQMWDLYVLWGHVHRGALVRACATSLSLLLSMKMVSKWMWEGWFKGVISKNLPPVEFILKSNVGQHVNRVTECCCSLQQLRLVALETHGRVSVYTNQTGDLYWDGLELSG